jgi:hypothetical protein
VKADSLVAMDIFIQKLTAPFERMFGFTLLGNSTVRSLQVGKGVFGGFNNTGNAVPVVPVPLIP